MSRDAAAIAQARAVWPITFEDVLAAEARIRPYLPATPVRTYAELDAAVGHGVRVVVKHENHNPTNAFKVRNGLSVMTALTEDERRRGVVTATRGNHGLGVAYAGQKLGVPVTICVPFGNNPEKNDAARGYGAALVEHGRDYDEAVEQAAQIARERGLFMAHSTNDARVIAGAATMTAEILRERPDVEAVVVAVGGGSQAVGAMTVTRALKPDVRVYGVQAEGAPAIHDAWHRAREQGRRGEAVPRSATTFADGLATRSVYEATFPSLCEGLASFITVTEHEIAAALRLLLRTTHNLAEGAGAASPPACASSPPRSRARSSPSCSPARTSIRSRCAAYSSKKFESRRPIRANCAPTLRSRSERPPEPAVLLYW